MCCFFFQAEDGIRDLVRSRGLGDVDERQPEQRAVLAELVEAYAGMLIWSPPKRPTGFNAVRHRFGEILALPHSRQAARAYVDYLTQLAARMQTAFPDRFLPERETLQQDVQIISDQLHQRYPEI